MKQTLGYSILSVLGAGTCLAVQYIVPLQQLFTSTWDLLLMAYFMSVRLKEGLTCMEESDPFAFEKQTPDTLVISDEDCMLYQHETQA